MVNIDNIDIELFKTLATELFRCCNLNVEETEFSENVPLIAVNSGYRVVCTYQDFWIVNDNEKNEFQPFMMRCSWKNLINLRLFGNSLIHPDNLTDDDSLKHLLKVFRRDGVDNDSLFDVDEVHFTRDYDYITYGNKFIIASVSPRRISCYSDNFYFYNKIDSVFYRAIFDYRIHRLCDEIIKNTHDM